MSTESVNLLVQAGAVGLLALVIILGFRYLNTASEAAAKANGKAAEHLNKIHEDLAAIITAQADREKLLVAGMEERDRHLVEGMTSLQNGQRALTRVTTKLVKRLTKEV
jgi:hypothetical protein